MSNKRSHITDLNVPGFFSSLRSRFLGNSDGLMRPTGTPVSPATSKDLSRRCFVRTSVVTTAGTLVGLGTNFAGPRPVLQTTLSPEAALNELIEGNQRYVTGSMTAHEHDLQVLQAKTAEKQQPFAAVLSCADSRVPVELVFDQTIGHLFVCRVAGNVTTPEIIASLEYGAAVLGTRVVLVLGHSNCGAVAAVIKGSAVPGQISALYPLIRPAVDLAGPNKEAAAKANAKIHAKLLAEASTVISSLVKENKIKVVAGYYDVTNGIVTLVD
jgi:carbonic anhydrase